MRQLQKYGDPSLKDIDDSHFCLHHDDITPKHLIVDKGGRLTGLIDWEWTFVMHPSVTHAIMVSSMGEMGVPIEYILPIHEFAKNYDELQYTFYFGRRLLLCCGYKHPKINLQLYSQTAIDKALKVLASKKVEVEDILWSELFTY